MTRLKLSHPQYLGLELEKIAVMSLTTGDTHHKAISFSISSDDIDSASPPKKGLQLPKFTAYALLTGRPASEFSHGHIAFGMDDAGSLLPKWNRSQS
jgi:hypothetical protein